MYVCRKIDDACRLSVNLLIVLFSLHTSIGPSRRRSGAAAHCFMMSTDVVERERDE